MNAIGLDLGTTTLSAVAVDCETGRVRATKNIANRSELRPDTPGARLQDPAAIAEGALGLAEELKARYGPVCAIGIDGQMHGMLYLDAAGNPLSPLHTWQDGRGDQPFEGGTYAGVLSKRSGYAMSTGFGLTTHYWYVQNQRVPQGAAAICTIFDYVAMRLARRTAPLAHASGAASMGLFDQDACRWDGAALARAGLDAALLPPVTDACQALGYDPDGVPVACAIGDNQASFLGSVREMAQSVLVNMGTGGQVSMMAGRARPPARVERRPLGEGRFIWAGSSLCGGRAYALLEGFLRGCAALGGYGAGPLYEAMNALGLQALRDGEALRVDTRFCGTRADPGVRGAIAGIGDGNFDAAHLIAGTLLGMAEELYALYGDMLDARALRPKFMIGSGNAIRKNPALVLAFEKTFGLPMYIPAHLEEAAYGAALFGMAAAGRASGLAHAQRLIAYRQ